MSQAAAIKPSLQAAAKAFNAVVKASNKERTAEVNEARKAVSQGQ